MGFCGFRRVPGCSAASQELVFAPRILRRSGISSKTRRHPNFQFQKEHEFSSTRFDFVFKIALVRNTVRFLSAESIFKFSLSFPNPVKLPPPIVKLTEDISRYFAFDSGTPRYEPVNESTTAIFTSMGIVKALWSPSCSHCSLRSNCRFKRNVPSLFLAVLGCLSTGSPDMFHHNQTLLLGRVREFESDDDGY